MCPLRVKEGRMSWAEVKQWLFLVSSLTSEPCGQQGEKKRLKQPPTPSISVRWPYHKWENIKKKWDWDVCGLAATVTSLESDKPRQQREGGGAGVQPEAALQSRTLAPTCVGFLCVHHPDSFTQLCPSSSDSQFQDDSRTFYKRCWACWLHSRGWPTSVSQDLLFYSCVTRSHDRQPHFIYLHFYTCRCLLRSNGN